MKEIIWDDSFSVGIQEIDHQHKKLIQIWNEFYRVSTLEVDSEEVSDTLNKLTDYAFDHFSAEEQLMVKYDFPGYDHHKDCHDNFWKSLAQFSVDTVEGITTVPRDMKDYIFKWIQDHMKGEDQGYKNFFRDKLQ